MKKILIFLLIIILASLGIGCSNQAEYSKYRTDFFDTFDTIVTVMAYTKTEAEFKELSDLVYNNFTQMNSLFDIYNDYEGVNNIKTINDNAGISPVKVDGKIIDLLITAKDWYKKTGGVVNVALGPVLNIWHDYRQEGLAAPDQAVLPPMLELLEANEYTDIDKVVIDAENSTVYIEQGMRLDVGAIAKGYATQVTADLLTEKGYDSVLISAGGNVKAIGSPKDGVRSLWGVGLKDPESPLELSVSESNILDAAYVSDMSVVSSGSYERFYVVDGQEYHHIIDPETLMPAEYYSAVTVMTQDSAAADILSTAIFILPPKKSMELVESLDGVEALWVMHDGEIIATEGMKQSLRDLGGASNE